jgi:RecA/RadA recombinase
MPKKKKEGDKLGTLRDIPAESFVSTGITEVDDLLGGGFPRRRITQVWGVPGAGKSYLLAKCLSVLDGKALYVDSEFALNKDRLVSMGIDLDKFDYLPSSKLEEVASFIIDNIADYDLVIIDTLAKLTPMTTLANDMDTPQIALAARKISQFESSLRPKLYASNAAIVGINQARANMGYGQAETKAAGGFAWLHTVDLSLKVARTAYTYSQKGGEKHGTGQWSEVKVDKSRVSAPANSVKFQIDYEAQSG